MADRRPQLELPAAKVPRRQSEAESPTLARSGRLPQLPLDTQWEILRLAWRAENHRSLVRVCRNFRAILAEPGFFRGLSAPTYFPAYSVLKAWRGQLSRLPRETFLRTIEYLPAKWEVEGYANLLRSIFSRKTVVSPCNLVRLLCLATSESDLSSPPIHRPQPSIENIGSRILELLDSHKSICEGKNAIWFFRAARTEGWDYSPLSGKRGECPEPLFLPALETLIPRLQNVGRIYQNFVINEEIYLVIMRAWDTIRDRLQERIANLGERARTESTRQKLAVRLLQDPKIPLTVSQSGLSVSRLDLVESPVLVRTLFERLFADRPRVLLRGVLHFLTKLYQTGEFAAEYKSYVDSLGDLAVNYLPCSAEVNLRAATTWNMLMQARVYRDDVDKYLLAILDHPLWDPGQPGLAITYARLLDRQASDDTIKTFFARLGRPLDINCIGGTVLSFDFIFRYRDNLLMDMKHPLWCPGTKKWRRHLGKTLGEFLQNRPEADEFFAPLYQNVLQEILEEIQTCAACNPKSAEKWQVFCRMQPRLLYSQEARRCLRCQR